MQWQGANLPVHLLAHLLVGKTCAPAAKACPGLVQPPHVLHTATTEHGIKEAVRPTCAAAATTAAAAAPTATDAAARSVGSRGFWNLYPITRRSVEADWPTGQEGVGMSEHGTCKPLPTPSPSRRAMHPCAFVLPPSAVWWCALASL